MEIAVRVYDELSTKTTEQEIQEPYKFKTYTHPNYKRIFVFDTETTADQYQNLLFGSFVVKRDNVIDEIGLFYNPDTVSEDGLNILKAYCKKDSTLRLYTLQEFNEDIFYQFVHRKMIPCIAFNMPFDISRLSIGFGYAKGKIMKGGFVFKLSDKAQYPPIRIKHLNSSQHSINFQSTQFSKFKGYFVDCQTLAGIMMDKKHVTLAAACKNYNKIYKDLDKDQEHGVIKEKYIDYNITDTLATAELFTKLKNEFDRFEVNLPIHMVFSSASIGKSALEKLGIVPFMVTV
jgi:hypothetical protein